VEDALNTLAFTKRGGGDGREAAAFRGGECQLPEQRKNIDVDVDKLYVKQAVANDARA